MRQIMAAMEKLEKKDKISDDNRNEPQKRLPADFTELFR
jgi:hypothetical protein